jgi:polar amino acid transport system substrate-binding protein
MEPKVDILKKIASLTIMLIIAGCGNEEDQVIRFATSADYPPFEFIQKGKLVGYDIDLAYLIAQELKKDVHFTNMQFSGILPSVQSGMIDVAIGKIAITEERKAQFDFSDPYYADSLVAVYDKKKPIKNAEQLKGSKIACQLGSAMEVWLKKNHPDEVIAPFDTNNQAIEALKSGHVDVVLMDRDQAIAFANENGGIDHIFLEKDTNGCGLVLAKGSKLTVEINKALKLLKERGELARLEQKWLEVSHE